MLDEHLGYLVDRVRLDRFRVAAARVVRSGDSVADLGCGSGVLGLLCLRAGAGRLFAIESGPVIEVARQSLKCAGFSDKATFLRGHSFRIELPEAVDVVICDHVGYLGFDYGTTDALRDAGRRFLKPGGRLIPSRIRLKLGAVESSAARDKAEAWSAEGVDREFTWLRRHAINSKHAVVLPREALLSAAADLGGIDLHADNPDFFSWSAELRIARHGILHGIAGWFECELAEGVWMTNSPLADRPIDRPQAFLPIDEPVEVRAGDLVRATLMARPADNLIAWVVELPASGRIFRHSTWQGMLVNAEDLTRAHPERVPHVSREGLARITVLGYCDGRRTVGEVEQAVLQEHPDLFPTRGEISRFVHQVLGRDTE